MTGEFNIGGVFIQPLLISALIAFVLSRLVESALDYLGVYKVIWHRGLFDLALLTIMWGMATAVISINGDPFFFFTLSGD